MTVAERFCNGEGFTIQDRAFLCCGIVILSRLSSETVAGSASTDRGSASSVAAAGHQTDHPGYADSEY